MTQWIPLGEALLMLWNQIANLVLQDTIERIFVQDLYADVSRGIFLVRGENVLLLGEIVRPPISATGLLIVFTSLYLRIWIKMTTYLNHTVKHLQRRYTHYQSKRLGIGSERTR